MYPHLRINNVEIASIDMEKKIMSFTVHYDGDSHDLKNDEIQHQLTIALSDAMNQLTREHYFEDDVPSSHKGWQFPACIMSHPN